MVRFLRLFGAALALLAVPAWGRPVEEAPVKEAPAKEAPAAESPRFMRSVEKPGRSIALEIAARTFVSSAPGAPSIVLVGVSHVGEHKLYAGLQSLLDGHDVVLYESVKPPGTGGAGGVDDKERAASTSWRRTWRPTTNRISGIRKVSTSWPSSRRRSTPAWPSG
jgi:hypothetical protein